MKRVLAVFAAVVMMSATAALAAPPRPVFNPPTKVGEGGISYERHKRMAFDGANIYVGYGTGKLDGSGPEAVRIAKSANNGFTWGLSTVLQAADASNPWIDVHNVRIIVTNDPLYPENRMIHAAWHSRGDGSVKHVYYSCYLTRPTREGWSTPVQIDFSSASAFGTNLAVTSDGTIHILFGNYYSTAESFDSPFTEPVALPNLPDGSGYDGETYMAKDPSDNLYAATVHDVERISFTRKSPGSSAWSDPVVVYSTYPGYLSRDIDLAVLDQNNFYIGFVNGPELGLLVSTDGGASWTKRTVLQDAHNGEAKLSIVVDINKNITYASEVYDVNGLNPVIQVWRSNDGGATWSLPALVKGQNYPVLSLDPFNKVHLLVMDETNFSVNSNLLWIRER